MLNGDSANSTGAVRYPRQMPYSTATGDAVAVTLGSTQKAFVGIRLASRSVGGFLLIAKTRGRGICAELVISMLPGVISLVLPDYLYPYLKRDKLL